LRLRADQVAQQRPTQNLRELHWDCVANEERLLGQVASEDEFIRERLDPRALPQS
jgi:hypothetical protein